jgi:hypothetical protein
MMRATSRRGRLPVRLLIRLVALLALGVIFAWRFLPQTPTIWRPPPHDQHNVALGSEGRNVETAAEGRAVAQAPYPILRMANVEHPQEGPCLLVLTAEEPGRQPRRSHLYLAPLGDLSRRRELAPEPTYNFWDLSVGDVDGDGQQEVALCTFSQTAREATFARRFFVYHWDKTGDLEPIWRGSQLARPYLTAALADVAGDDAAELVSVERALSGKLIVVAYEWNQFGFWGLGHTAEYDAISTVTPLRHGAGEKWLRLKVRRDWHKLELLWRP